MGFDESDDDEVGYCKPPKWTRFTSGKSGNPKGRPRKPRQPQLRSTAESLTDDILRGELGRPIRVTDGTGTHEIATHHVVQRSQIQSAVKGNSFAQREVLKAARELEARDAARRQAEEEQKREIFAKIVQWRMLRVRAWAEVEKGCEPSEPWPHPDDMLIDHNKQAWRIRGPLDAEDLPHFEYCRAERDALFARAMLDRCERPAEDFAKPSIWDLWIAWDVMLPLRWQAVPDVDKWDHLLCLPIRALRRLEHERTADARALRVSAGIPPHGKDEYRFANAVMKPLLQRQGYRSLAEFERAYEATGGDPPWPKTMPRTDGGGWSTPAD